ncbi:hypothetical protein ACQPYK_45295 [Streptosporangium sp. CA-135522]|uniref:hypothetical protein n=1 Tax=Streptosporangium sp. CA-135522 TaxID=3240072 RepID=UPI003D931635
MHRVRPTLRVLRDDLELPIPSAQVPLETISHPLLDKASEQFADPGTPHERIRAIDDVVLFKVKVRRWRGAVWADEPDAEVRTWLVAAGIREDGSGDDFYTALESSAKAARARYNAERDQPLTTGTYSGHLLPNRDDHDRYRLEAATRFVLRLNSTVRDLARGSLRDGHEHAIDFPGFRLGIQIRADDGNETYAAIRITGSVPANLTAMILSRVPGCGVDGWFPEYALPERHLLPAEQAWSNIMDPKPPPSSLRSPEEAGMAMVRSATPAGRPPGRRYGPAPGSGLSLPFRPLPVGDHQRSPGRSPFTDHVPGLSQNSHMAENADGAAYADAVSGYAALGRDGLREAAHAVEPARPRQPSACPPWKTSLTSPSSTFGNAAARDIAASST